MGQDEILSNQEPVMPLVTPTTVNTAYVLTRNGIAIFVDGTPLPPIGRDHPSYDAIREALNSEQFELIPDLINLGRRIEKFMMPGMQEGFEVKAGIIYLKGEPFTEEVSGKVLRMEQEGFSTAPLLNFLRKVRENPSMTSQNELLLFCEANGFAIHADGDVIAYKRVNSDFRDYHTNAIDNSVGKLVEMPRNKVDDRRHQTCSFGLHFAAFEFAQGFGGTGGHLMVLKVNPKDVVSIPEDYQNQKGRCCRYEVVAELKDPSKALPYLEVYSDADIIDPSRIAKLYLEKAKTKVLKDFGDIRIRVRDAVRASLSRSLVERMIVRVGLSLSDFSDPGLLLSELLAGARDEKQVEMVRKAAVEAKAGWFGSDTMDWDEPSEYDEDYDGECDDEDEDEDRDEDEDEYDDDDDADSDEDDDNED